MKHAARTLCALLMLTAALLSLGACKNKKDFSELSHISEKVIDGETFYFIDDDYEGNYSIQTVVLAEDLFEYAPKSYDKFDYFGVMSYPELIAFCHTWGINQIFSENANYVVEAGTMDFVSEIDVRLGAVEYDEKDETLTLYRSTDYEYGGRALGYCIIMPTDKDVQDIRVERAYLPGQQPNCEETEAKPVIYLYPETETALTVTLGHPERLSCAYPAYRDGWTVSAKPDGTMTDLSTGRSLYALYWEGRNADFRMTDEGFCVAGADTAAFLEKALSKLGLNEREAEEFIIYWLPLMEDNAYNYIHFASAEEIENYMPLSFSVQPDSVIRINMVWKALDAPVALNAQVLETPERSGFAVVEWGGVHLK